MLARAHITNHGKFKLISLPIKEKVTDATETKVVTEAVNALLDACGELRLSTVSICTGDIDGLSKQKLRRLLEDSFRGTTTRILICTNQISITPVSDRRKILKELHASAIGGHKGVTKTYRRLMERYNWQGMKKDVQEFIRGCRTAN